MSTYILGGRPRTKKEEKESQIECLIIYGGGFIATIIFILWAVLF